MRKRYQHVASLIGGIRTNFYEGWALRDCLAAGYSAGAFRGDLLAGIAVGIVALPLAMALAINSGVRPEYGLYTTIFAGAVIAMLGGSRITISGSSAAFVVILLPIASEFGHGGLLVATLMAGAILVLMGIAGMGRLVQYVPHPVTTGFTAGVGVVLATMQVKNFFGLQMPREPSHFLEKLQLLWEHAPTFRWQDTLVGAVALAILIVWQFVTRKVPGALVATAATALLAWGANRLWGFEVATIASKFSYTVGGESFPGIPPLPPRPELPWMFPGKDGAPVGLSLGMVRELVMPATVIALLVAIESLLSAVVADGMSGTKHDPDRELIGQGVGNIVAPFFGGIPASGAIARTAMNVRAGGRTPIAAIVHSAFVLAAMVALAPLLGYLPMAAMAAMLLMVAWNMSDAKHFVHILKVAPASDVTVLLTCFSLTVVFDMVVSVSVGVVLAALLFMKRMAEMTQTRLLNEQVEPLYGPVPPGVLVYEIAGPLFFGAAEKAVSLIDSAAGREKLKAVIVHLGAVPHIDVTGLVALESLVAHLRHLRTFVIFSGVQDQPAKVMEKAGIVSEAGRLAFCYDLEQAIMLAEVAAPERLSMEVRVRPA